MNGDVKVGPVGPDPGPDVGRPCLLLRGIDVDAAHDAAGAGGQVYVSADAGDSWAPIVRDLPAVLSVEVQTLS